jgi:hypothetical protein
MAMIRVKPSTGPRIPSLVSLSSLTVAFDLVAAVDRHRNPEEIWKDPSWKAFRQSLQQVTFNITSWVAFWEMAWSKSFSQPL